MRDELEVFSGAWGAMGGSLYHQSAAFPDGSGQHTLRDPAKQEHPSGFAETHLQKDPHLPHQDNLFAVFEQSISAFLAAKLLGRGFPGGH